MITFYFCYKELGGVQVLIYNLIKELYDNGTQTKLIHFKDTWLTQNLNKNNVEFMFLDIEDIDTEKVSNFMKNDDILVTTGLVDEFVFFRKINPYFLFWNVFPDILKIKKSKFLLLRKISRRRLLKQMIKNKGIVFMDNTGVKSIESEFGLKLIPDFLPIPINISNENYFLKSFRKKIDNCINITYLGRAVIWKINPVIKVINDLNNCEFVKGEIVFHIITDNIETFKELLNISSKSFEIKFYSDLSDDSLKEFLISTSDLHIAMGTSCIEASSLGIPSILIDASFIHFPEDYRYRWIFENDRYCLGEMLDGSVIISRGVHMNEIISLYKETRENELVEISNMCFEYTKKNHDLKIIAKDFLNICHNSKFKIRNFLFNDIYYFAKSLWYIVTKR
jgi:hypothetical protein